jgi:hypothetical protein
MAALPPVARRDFGTVSSMAAIAQDIAIAKAAEGMGNDREGSRRG